jgi:F-type H+-transporting ATPase subunit epsilon
VTEFRFRLIVPEGSLFEGEVTEVTVPTGSGEIAILADHMPMVTPVATGVLTVGEEGTGHPDHFAIERGILRVFDDEVVLSAGSAIHADRIDELQAQRALVEARATLTSVLSDEEVAATEGAVERQMAHLEAFERHKHYHARH